MSTEIAVFRFLQKEFSLPTLAALVLAANVFSWIAGVLAGDLLDWGGQPSGWVWVGPPAGERLVRSPEYAAVAGWSFVTACVLSFLLEWGFLALAGLVLRRKFRHLAACTGAANVASYAVLFAFARFMRAY